jgi:hypothetical protein
MSKKFVGNDCFSAQACHSSHPLQKFLELPPQKNGEEKVGEVIDKFQSLCVFWWNPRDIQKYPEFMKMAVRFGYDPLDFDEEKLRRRYVPYLSVLPP